VLGLQQLMVSAGVKHTMTSGPWFAVRHTCPVDIAGCRLMEVRATAIIATVSPPYSAKLNGYRRHSPRRLGTPRGLPTMSR
jgi:hypothetical protein